MASPRGRKRHSAGSVFPVSESPKSGPPAGATERKRASSFSFITKLLPSNRPERGGTIRTQGFWEEKSGALLDTVSRTDALGGEGNDSNRILSWNMAQDLPKRASSTQSRHGQRSVSLGEPRRIGARNPNRQSWSPQREPWSPHQSRAPAAEIPVTSMPGPPTSTQERSSAQAAQDEQSRTQQLFQSKKEARRRRQSLKESGDFLGVQGINPETGEMDVLTPTTTSSSTAPPNLSLELGGLAKVVNDAKVAYREAKRQHEAELKKTVSQKEEQKLEKLEKEKEAIRKEQRHIRWRKEAGQWSSVAEPNLSPIAQSQRSGTTSSEKQKALSPSRRPHKSELVAVSERSSPAVSGQLVAASPTTDEGVRGSSETIIHTPSRRPSPYPYHYPGPLLTPIRPRGSPAVVPNKENKSQGSPATLEAPRMESNSSNNLGALSNASYDSHREFASFERSPDSSNFLVSSTNDSFLGHLPSPALHLEEFLSETITTPSWGAEHHPTTKVQEIELGIADVATHSEPATIHRTDGIKGTVTKTSGESHVKPSHEAPLRRLTMDNVQKLATTPVKAELSLFRRRPRIPERFVPRRREATPLRKPEEKLIAEIETPQPLAPAMPQQPRVKVPESSLLDDPAGEWANTLMKDINIVSRASGTQGRSAFTPITTTTGFDRSLLNRAFAAFDGAADTKGAQANPSLNELAQAFAQPGPSIKETTDASQPKTTQKDSSNDVPRHEIPTTAISSVRQLSPTKLRTERLSPKASLPRMVDTDTSHMSTCTSHHGPDWPAKGVTNPSGEEMALEAAQAAMARTMPVDGAQDRPDPSRQLPSTVLAEDDIGDHSRLVRYDSTEQQYTYRQPGVLKLVLYMILRAIWAYWCLVRPCFDSTSPMRKRLDARRSTWGDVVLTVLALVFILLMLAAGIWTFHSIMLVSDMIKSVVKGVAIFIGL